MTKNKLQTTLTTIIILLATINTATAVIIEETSSNQYDYQNGDLIEITMDTNAQGLDITADFSNVDSNYNPNMVLVEEKDTTYKIYYPITFTNEKGDNDYNVVLTAYDPITSTTSSVTYLIRLKNQGERQEDSRKVEIKVTEEDTIDLRDDQIQICDTNGCEILTEREYEQSRKLIIKEGNVTLSNLTYNQLKTEISDETREAMKEELIEYLTEIRQIKKRMDTGLYDLQDIIEDQRNLSEQNQEAFKNSLRKSRTNNIIVILIVLIIISLFSYTIYLRTETTWLR